MKIKCLIYCTKAKPYLYRVGTEKWWYNEGCYEPFAYMEGFDLYNKKQKENSTIKEGEIYTSIFHNLNGKIVASFDCEKVEVFTTDYRGDREQNKRIVKDSCVPLGYLADYEVGKHFLYAIHISNVKVFDKPLSFQTDYIYKDYKTNAVLTKAPQNMCNVYDRFGNHYVLISIRPEWVAKILNGEKTIEVRKKVVNKLKELSESE